MSEETVTVNKKGQFTIPARFRKQFRIQEGTKLLVSQDEYAMTVRRVPEFNDLLGMHAGKITYPEMLEELGQMRKQDRY
ncbi:MAG TPA: AbrB/MazE/SpoVT family DNA-binding domain-containing protein [Nitrososphaerales archaeon]|nr:AbrB/MazE/SpoVT family DNA-binding domain-containing protein [Nitrososphaerales archaeon]